MERFLTWPVVTAIALLLVLSASVWVWKSASAAKGDGHKAKVNQWVRLLNSEKTRNDAIDAVVEALEGSDPVRRDLALLGLYCSKPAVKRAVPIGPLVSLLEFGRDTTPRCYSAILLSMRRTDEDVIVPVLLRELERTEDLSLASTIVSSLGRIGSRATLARETLQTISERGVGSIDTSLPYTEEDKRGYDLALRAEAAKALRRIR